MAEQTIEQAARAVQEAGKYDAEFWQVAKTLWSPSHMGLFAALAALAILLFIGFGAHIAKTTKNAEVLVVGSALLTVFCLISVLLSFAAKDVVESARSDAWNKNYVEPFLSALPEEKTELFDFQAERVLNCKYNSNGVCRGDYGRVWEIRAKYKDKDGKIKDFYQMGTTAKDIRVRPSEDGRAYLGSKELKYDLGHEWAPQTVITVYQPTGRKIESAGPN